jgi:ATP-dependent RNA circularization protein (DNA/RNA ligase family)
VAGKEGAMSAFFRYPHIPHVEWLGAGAPRDDKVLSPKEAEKLLSGEVLIEEKLDGANLGISLGPDGALRFQNRGQYLRPPYVGQFRRLSAWIAPREQALIEALTPAVIVFGEWCAAVHSVQYTRLPDWFIVFDVYDRDDERFLSITRRDSLASDLGLVVVPLVVRGRTTVAALKARVMTEGSRYRTGPIEGFIIRRESSRWIDSRAKLVHPQFVQDIAEHWRHRRIEGNRLGDSLNGRTSHKSRYERP